MKLSNRTALVVTLSLLGFPAQQLLYAQTSSDLECGDPVKDAAADCAEIINCAKPSASNSPSPVSSGQVYPYTKQTKGANLCPEGYAGTPALPALIFPACQSQFFYYCSGKTPTVRAIAPDLPLHLENGESLTVVVHHINPLKASFKIQLDNGFVVESGLPTLTGIINPSGNQTKVGTTPAKPAPEEGNGTPPDNGTQPKKVASSSTTLSKEDKTKVAAQKTSIQTSKNALAVSNDDLNKFLTANKLVIDPNTLQVTPEPGAPKPASTIVKTAQQKQKTVNANKAALTSVEQSSPAAECSSSHANGTNSHGVDPKYIASQDQVDALQNDADRLSVLVDQLSAVSNAQKTAVDNAITPLYADTIDRTAFTQVAQKLSTIASVPDVVAKGETGLSSKYRSWTLSAVAADLNTRAKNLHQLMATYSDGDCLKALPSLSSDVDQDHRVEESIFQGVDGNDALLKQWTDSITASENILNADASNIVNIEKLAQDASSFELMARVVPKSRAQNDLTVTVTKTSIAPVISTKTGQPAPSTTNPGKPAQGAPADTSSEDASPQAAAPGAGASDMSAQPAAPAQQTPAPAPPAPKDKPAGGSQQPKPAQTGQSPSPAPAPPSKAPAPPSGDGTNPVTSSTTSQVIVTFGHGPYLAESVGVAFSPLEQHSYQATTVGSSGSCTASLTPAPGWCISDNGSSKIRFTPVLLGNIRFSDKWDNHPFAPSYVSVGVGIRASTDSTTTLEYMMGLTLPVANKNFFVTTGAYAGSVQHLGGGLKVGPQTGTQPSSIPTYNSYEVGFGFALTWKFAGQGGTKQSSQ